MKEIALLRRTFIFPETVNFLPLLSRETPRRKSPENFDDSHLTVTLRGRGSWRLAALLAAVILAAINPFQGLFKTQESSRQLMPFPQLPESVERKKYLFSLVHPQ